LVKLYYRKTCCMVINSSDNQSQTSIPTSIPFNWGIKGHIWLGFGAFWYVFTNLRSKVSARDRTTDSPIPKIVFPAECRTVRLRQPLLTKSPRFSRGFFLLYVHLEWTLKSEVFVFSKTSFYLRFASCHLLGKQNVSGFLTLQTSQLHKVWIWLNYRISKVLADFQGQLNDRVWGIFLLKKDTFQNC